MLRPTPVFWYAGLVTSDDVVSWNTATYGNDRKVPGESLGDN